MNAFRPRHIAALALAIAACSSDGSESVDSTATYEVYGEVFEPGIAVPAPAVFAEPAVYIGQSVIIEGVATECADRDCIAAISSGGDARILVVRSDSVDSLQVPADVTGRRIVVSGKFATTTDSTYRLRATGLMAEKVRP